MKRSLEVHLGPVSEKIGGLLWYFLKAMLVTLKK